jgi:hypothetical protein
MGMGLVASITDIDATNQFFPDITERDTGWDGEAVRYKKIDNLDVNIC